MIVLTPARVIEVSVIVFESRSARSAESKLCHEPASRYPDQTVPDGTVLVSHIFQAFHARLPPFRPCGTSRNGQPLTANRER